MTKSEHAAQRVWRRLRIGEWVVTPVPDAALGVKALTKEGHEIAFRNDPRTGVHEYMLVRIATPACGACGSLIQTEHSSSCPLSGTVVSVGHCGNVRGLPAH